MIVRPSSAILALLLGIGLPGFVAATAPPGVCPAATTAHVSASPIVIPDPGTVAGTIQVAGIGGFIWDVDLTTSLDHSANGQLDVVLTSPAGTAVSVTTGNGGTFDGIFDGTRWDDQAGMPVTDAGFADGVAAVALIPEEAMGAFIGENPNGIWTIALSDGSPGDAGTLASWSLVLTAFAAGPQPAAVMSFSNPTSVPIADLATVTSPIVVSGAGTALCGLSVTTSMPHTFNADLDVTLTSPAGTVVTLTTDSGQGFANGFDGTLWSDDAGTANPPGPVTDSNFTFGATETPLVPEGALAAFYGEDPNGTWTLTLTDDELADIGTLTGWSLGVETCSPSVNMLTSWNGVLDAGDSQQTGRLDAIAPGGTCALPEACPALAAVGARAYDAYTFTNTTAAAVCFQADLTTACTGANSIFAAAYLGSFDPANLCAAYVADVGNFGVASASMAFTIPAAGVGIVVVHEINPGAGCAGYSLVVGAVCAIVPDPAACAPDTVAPAVVPPAPLVLAASVCQGSTPGATGATSAAVAAFLDGGTASDACDFALLRLPPQVGGIDADASTFFPIGTTAVTFRFEDDSANTGSAASSVTVELFYADLNLDGARNAGDAVILSNYQVGNLSQGVPPFLAPFAAADLNRDGLVNAVDQVILANYLVGNVPCLPV